MGLFEDIFGGKESTTIPQRINIQSREQRDALQFLEPLLEGTLGDVSTQVPELSELQATSLAGLENFAAELVSRGVAEPSALETAATGSLQNILAQGPEELNAILAQTVDQPLLDILEQQTLPQIANRFAGNQNFFGGERITAGERARESTIGQIGRSRAGATLDLFGRQIEAATAAPSVARLGLVGQERDRAGIENLLSLLAGGGVARDPGLEQIDLESQRINQLLGLLGVGTNVVASETRATETKGALAAAGDIAKIVALASSDKRIKKNITFVGKINNIPMYTFKYIFGKQLYLGTMAQDVKHIPNAVVKMFGIYFVNYSLLNIGNRYGRL